MVPDFGWDKSKQWTERTWSSRRQDIRRQNITHAAPEHVGELLAEWGIVGANRRQRFRIIKFPSSVALEHAADMAKPDERRWHTRDKIDPVN